MRSSVRLTAWLPLIALLAAGPAAAQFTKPKLPKVGPIGGKAPAEAQRGAAPAPTFNDRVIEITDERAEGLLAGFRAELAALDASDQKRAAARAAYEEENKRHAARLKEYEGRKKTWQDCQDADVKPAQDKVDKKATKAEEDITGGDKEAFDRRMEELSKRMEAAQAKGDMAEMMRISDSISKSAGMASSVEAGAAGTELQAAMQKCGPEPAAPEPPTPPSDAQFNVEQEGTTAANQEVSSGGKITPEQYAIMKERVRPVVCGGSGASGGFSESEAAAINKRKSELCKAGKALQDKGY
jgi:hypothetical protein